MFLRVRVRFVENVISQAISKCFPMLAFKFLLPFDGTRLLDLRNLEERLYQQQELRLDGKSIPPAIYEAFMSSRGFRDYYHCFLSYRVAANSKFVGTLADLLSCTVLEEDKTKICVFYDRMSLIAAVRFDVQFCNALSKSALAIPIISLQAMDRFKTLSQADYLDFVLLEWALMLALVDADRLKHVYPPVQFRSSRHCYHIRRSHCICELRCARHCSNKDI